MTPPPDLDAASDLDEADFLESQEEMGTPEMGVADMPAPPSWPMLEATARPEYPRDDTLRLNQIAMKCTHNSYHIEPARPVVEEHQYTHITPLEQAERQGVRGFEFDVQPGRGWPVFHILGLDQETNCADLPTCLGQLKHWSDQRPGHHMLVIWIELKDELSAQKITDYDGLDALLRASFGRDKILEPDDLLRGEATLLESIERHGWPTLAETRDKVMFAMINTGARHQDAYLRPDDSLTNRVMFPRARPDQFGRPWAVLAKIDDPNNVAPIEDARARGMLIASNVGLAKHPEARNVMTRQRAFDLGVHIHCDDFVGFVEDPEPLQQTWLELPDGAPSACNPTSTTPETCVTHDVERLPR
jgi:hypothetical protein